jgi:hypothetical protein
VGATIGAPTAGNGVAALTRTTAVAVGPSVGTANFAVNRVIAMALVRRTECSKLNHDGLESAKRDLQSVFKKPGGGTAEL